MPVSDLSALLPVSSLSNSSGNEALQRFIEWAENPEAKFAEWGLDTNVQLSAYTVGIAPAIRVALSDAEKFQSALTGFEEEHSFSPQVSERGGQTVRLYPMDPPAKPGADDSGTDSGVDSASVGTKQSEPQPAIVVATGKKDVLMGILFDSSDEKMLDSLIGVTKPETSLVQSGKLKTIRKQWDYGDEMAMFIDLKNIAGTVTGSESRSAQQLQALLSSSASADANLAMLRGEPCRAEITGVAEAFPMMVSGTRSFEIKDNALKFSSHFAAVLKNTLLLDTLKLFRGVVPLSQSGSHPMLSLGVGLTVDNLAQAVGQISQLLGGVNFQCNALRPVNQVASADLSAASMGVVMFGGLARGVRGLSVNVFDIDIDSQGSAEPIKSVDTAIAVSADDPSMLIQTLQMMPQLGMLGELPLDGSEISLNEMLPIPMPAEIELKAAVKAKNIVIYSGEKGTDFANRLGGNDLEGFMHTTIDTNLIVSKLKSVMDMVGTDVDEELLEMINSYPKGTISYGIDFTDQGIELDSSGKYQLPGE